MAARKQAKSASQKKKSKMPTWLIAFPAIVIMIYFLSFAALLVFLGMLPSFVAHYVDRSPNRGTTKVVTACNASGIVPFIADLMAQGISSASVHALLLNSTTWLVILGAASCGWALVWGLPQITYAVLDMMQKNNIWNLEKRQRNIIDEWGEEVESTLGRTARNAAFREERIKPTDG